MNFKDSTVITICLIQLSPPRECKVAQYVKHCWQGSDIFKGFASWSRFHFHFFFCNEVQSSPRKCLDSSSFQDSKDLFFRSVFVDQEQKYFFSTLRKYNVCTFCQLQSGVLFFSLHSLPNPHNIHLIRTHTSSALIRKILRQSNLFC